MSNLTGHCINTVVFTGENELDILEHFNRMEQHTPPFLAIMVYENALHFDSRWTPPIRSLNEIAEQFDVSYKIDYRVPYEDRGTYNYTCLQQQPLSPQAGLLRAFINAADSSERLAETEIHLTRHILAQSLDLHELEVLSYLAGKKYHEVRLIEIQNNDNPDRNDNEHGRKIGR
jgi:hypothetical protein